MNDVKIALTDKPLNSDDLFDTMFNAIEDYLFILDKHGLIISANDVAKQKLEYTFDELSGMDITQLHPPQRRDQVREMVKEMIDRKGSKCLIPLMTKSGKLIPVETRVFQTKWYGEDVIFGISKDVSEQKDLEKRLEEQKVYVETASEMKSRFLANISHEMRTPMNGVMGFLQLLKGTHLDNEQLEIVKEAVLASRVMMNVINDILDISKIESRKVVMEKRQLELPALVERVINFYKKMALEKKVQVESIVKPNVPSKLIGDPVRIKQIISNLLGNAVKFTSQGSITCWVELIETINGKAKIQVEVRDTGIGIKSEVAKKLFNPFIQEDLTSTREYGGMGLGLAISKELVEMMGGEIWVESKPGEGSSFFFTIMLEEA